METLGNRIDLFCSVMSAREGTKLNAVTEYKKTEELRAQALRVYEIKKMLDSLHDDIDPKLLFQLNLVLFEYDKLMRQMRREVDEHEWRFLNSIFE